MESAFGVEHPGVIFKRDDERARRYGQVAGTMGALGATSAALGTGSATVGHLERKGHDPMGFTMREHHKLLPMVPAHRKRVLEINSAAHGKQAKVAGGLAAASLAVAGAAKVKQKRELSKARKTTDTTLDAATVGTGGAAVAGGGYMAHQLGGAAAAHADNWRVDSHNLRAAKKGHIRMGVKEKAFAQASRKVSRRVVGVKGAGALAGVGAAGLGAAGIYEGTRNLRKKPS